ncbi:transposase [Mesorhizobium australicum]|uniref:transposase n=1 Tax=Mesorhizobium australicum TaxID=536018 RepID=UPI000A1CB47F|nr:transposase [Mesorhizobium australicum]
MRPIPSRLDRNWPGATRIVRLERLRELKDRCSRQIVYAITSIPPEAMDAEALLALARAHWQIENRLFRVRDGAFAEDACRVRPEARPRRSPICATPASPSSANAIEAKAPRRGLRSKPQGCHQSRHPRMN